MTINDMEAVVVLIETAKKRITNGEPEAALWRLADAAGIVAKYSNEDVKIGYDIPTGLGRQIVKKEGSIFGLRVI